MSLNLIQVQMRLRGAKESAAQMKAVSSSMKGMAATAAASTATAASGFKKMLPSMAAVKSAGMGMKSVGRTMTTNLTLPIVAVGAVSGKMAIDFSDAMNQIQTQAGATAAEVAVMREGILAYAASGKSSEGPQTLAEGMYRIASAGFRGADAMEALQKAEELATVGRSDLEKTSTALAAALKTGIKGTGNMDKTVGLLNATVGAGNMRMEDLVSSLGTGVLPSAKAAGLSLQDYGAALATMTSQGMPANASATRLRMALSMLQNPTDEAAEALGKLGLKPMELAKQMQQGNFLGMLANLKQSLEGMSKTQQQAQISEIFGGGRSSAGIILLLESLDEVNGKYKQIGNNAGKFGKLLDEANKEPGIKLQQAWAQIQTAFIELGDAILPVVVPMIQKAAGFMVKLGKGFDDMSPTMKTVIVVFAGLLAVAGPLLSMIGAMTLGIYGISAAMAFLAANPIVLIIAGIVALAAGLYIAYQKVGWFRDGVDAVFNFVKTNWQLIVGIMLGPIGIVVGGIIKHFGKIRKGITTAVNAVIGFVKNNWKTILVILTGPVGAAALLISKHWDKITGGARAVASWVRTAFNNVVSAIASVPGRIASAASGMFDGVKNAFKSAINFIINGWNSLSFTIPKIDPPGPGPTFGGQTISVPQIPALADGGHITGAGWSIVGDMGPELLNLPRGATVVPLGGRAPGASTNPSDGSDGLRTAQDRPLIHTHVYIGEREVAEAVTEAGERRRAFR